MATRKMTFSIPEDLAARLVRSVPARERSKYLADALSEKLAASDRLLIEACMAANRETDIRAIEKEFEALASYRNRN